MYTTHTHSHTPRGYNKVYYSHESRAGSQTGPNCLARARKQDCLVFYGVTAHMPGLMYYEHLAITKGSNAQSFLSACSDVGQKGKRKEWGLKTVGSQKLKNGVRLFIMSTLAPLFPL